MILDAWAADFGEKIGAVDEDGDEPKRNGIDDHCTENGT